jgi:hypothetical protein
MAAAKFETLPLRRPQRSAPKKYRRYQVNGPFEDRVRHRIGAASEAHCAARRFDHGRFGADA